MDESAELCGIPGDNHQPITKDEFNRLVSQVKFYHYRPMQQGLKEMRDLLEKHHELLIGHIKQDKIWFAKISGAKWALWTMAGCLAFLLPLIWQLIRALRIADVM